VEKNTVVDNCEALDWGILQVGGWKTMLHENITIKNCWRSRTSS